MLGLQTITLLALAVLPGLFLTTYVYQRDTVDAEPVGLLWSLVALGALSALPASVLEGVGEPIVRSLARPNTPFYYLVTSFCVVAVAEEGCKFAVLYLRTWRHPAFDYRFDGIVYCVMAAVGFATLENILYVLGNGFETGVARALLSVPGHVAWGVLMGYYYGRAKAFEVAGDSRQSRRNRTRALIVPILFHGAYDTCAFINGPMFFILLGIALAGDILMVYLVRRESKNDAAFWRPIAQVGFAGYAAYQAGAPLPSGYGQSAYGQSAYGRPGYVQPASGYAPQSTYQQQAPRYTSSQRAMPSQAPAQARTMQPAAAPYAHPGYAYPAPMAAAASYGQAASKPFSWLKFLAVRILAYLGIGLGLFVVGIIFALSGNEGIVYEFIIYLLALMLIGFWPYVLIMLFAGGMKKRRAARGLA